MKKPVLLILIALLAGACSQHGKMKYRATVSGTITVADSIDATGDFSQIEFIVLYPDTSGVSDTLMRARTNKKGEFRGQVRFPGQGRYPVEVRRFQRIVSTSSLLLGDRDTVRVEAQLPGFVQTAKVSSNEQRTFETYSRLNRNFERIVNLVQAGVLKPDTIPDITRVWSGLYWELFDQNPETYAGKLSAAESVRLSTGLGDSVLLERLTKIKKTPMLGQVTASLAAPALARTGGLDNALRFLDEMQAYHKDREDRGSLIRLKVEMLADSGRTDRALQELKKHSDLSETWPAFKFWMETVEKDLTELAPGSPAPAFSIVAGADTLSLDKFTGRPLLIEFTSFANENYQAQYERMLAIQLVYRTAGLEMLTIPIDQNPVLYEGFFQERAKNWTFTNAGEFQRTGIGTAYNVRTVPLRVLISREGKIIRKYSGANIELLFSDLQTQLQKEPS